MMCVYVCDVQFGGRQKAGKGGKSGLIMSRDRGRYLRPVTPKEGGRLTHTLMHREHPANVYVCCISIRAHPSGHRRYAARGCEESG